MRIRLAVMGGAMVVTMMLSTVTVFGQGRTPFKIKRIDARLVVLPFIKGAVTGEAETGARAQRKWLELTTEFDSEPEWADDLTVKYYVLMLGKDPEPKLFGGEVTYVNIEKGRGHLSGMYMDPNTVVRYTRANVDKIPIHVEIWHKGSRVEQDTQPTPKSAWWEGRDPVRGFLLSPLQTPWLSYSGKFESVKSSSRLD